MCHWDEPMIRCVGCQNDNGGRVIGLVNGVLQRTIDDHFEETVVHRHLLGYIHVTYLYFRCEGTVPQKGSSAGWIKCSTHYYDGNLMGSLYGKNGASLKSIKGLCIASSFPRKKNTMAQILWRNFMNALSVNDIHYRVSIWHDKY
jgi:hypothetical protein